ncbi:hypothetical protein [Candidatus Nitrotoga arctica]|uniref:Uncharacterized protein n=1 Tax=Candidatus Nitrotoga arctica TaxID=453162 RepID=A0ABM8Z0F1_9PROT|nr:hypothetical protein [Candidatus Nitrotoga arctica]CAG9933334.1 conserved exported protein of unknown function [Candidatus Nitrotoga arctica]
MRKVKSILFILLSVFFVSPVFADIKSMVGSNTLVMCETDNLHKSPGSDFLKMFPKLLVLMNGYRQKGIVTDAYFMQKLSEGVVFVVATTPSGDSQAYAEEIISKSDEIFKEGKSGRRINCTTHSIGPKWLPLP